MKPTLADNYGDAMSENDADERLQLIALIEQIRSKGFDTDQELDMAVSNFQSRVLHPRSSDLLFYPRHEFDHDPTAAEIADRALAYRPIELLPSCLSTRQASAACRLAL